MGREGVRRVRVQNEGTAVLEPAVQRETLMELRPLQSEGTWTRGVETRGEGSDALPAKAERFRLHRTMCWVRG